MKKSNVVFLVITVHLAGMIGRPIPLNDIFYVIYCMRWVNDVVVCAAFSLVFETPTESAVDKLLSFFDTKREAFNEATFATALSALVAIPISVLMFAELYYENPQTNLYIDMADPIIQMILWIFIFVIYMSWFSMTSIKNQET